MILPERVFGRPGATGSRPAAIGPISLADPGDQLLAQRLGRPRRASGDVGVDALALDVVRIADDGGLGDRGARRPARSRPRRAHAVAGDVDHVVDAAGDPVIAVLVARQPSPVK